MKVTIGPAALYYSNPQIKILRRHFQGQRVVTRAAVKQVSKIIKTIEKTPVTRRMVCIAGILYQAADIFK